MRGAERRNDRLVDGLVKEGVLRDPRIEAAFRAVDRHWFLPAADLADVYSDRAVVTHRAADGVAISSSSQPALMVRMLEQLEVAPGLTVLEIGTGTGYNAALLGRLVGPEGRVLTVDVDPDVTGPAARHLAAAGADNVTVVTGDGWAPPVKPVDRTVATVGVWDISPAWVEQLRPDGVLVVPLWLRAGQQASIAFRKAGGRRLESSSVAPCGFMRMRGPGAGEPTYQKVSGWTVSLDRPSPSTVRVLAELLDSPSSVRVAPRLEPGWFTSVALREPDAIHLYADGPGGPTVLTGILRLDPPGLAVVETSPPAVPRLRTFGSDAPLSRLLDLLERVPAVDPTRLVISAGPAGEDVDGAGALATLVRPDYAFVVRAGRGS